MTNTLTKRSQLKTIVNNYILNAIDGSGYDKDLKTDEEKLQFLADTFISEYCYPENLRYYGSYQKCFENWIMGLPSSFNIDFENYRIIEIAKEWGSLKPDADDRAEDKILDNWFNYIASHTMQLFSKYGIVIKAK